MDKACVRIDRQRAYARQCYIVALERIRCKAMERLQRMDERGCHFQDRVEVESKIEVLGKEIESLKPWASMGAG